LHMAQLMPLPLTVSCFSKIQIGFTFLVPAHPGRPGQRAIKPGMQRYEMIITLPVMIMFDCSSVKVKILLQRLDMSVD